VRNQDGRDVVFIAQNGRAERRGVTVGTVQDNEATLTAGVAAGERVIVDPPGGLADGARVREAKP
jgi:HlyD family secretion protein